MKLNIALIVEVDDSLSIPEMKAAVLRDVKAWLATAPIMAQLAEAEDSLKAAHG